MSSAPRLVPTTVSAQVLSEFASDVVIGLSQPGQKELPSKYLYDEVGSALFDVICVLPEYGLSRAGKRILSRHAGDVVDRLPSPVIVAELGSGSGQKTRLLLEALARKQRVNYYPIDISGSALSRCQQELGQIDRVSIVASSAHTWMACRRWLRAAAMAKRSSCCFLAARSAISIVRLEISFCVKSGRSCTKAMLCCFRRTSRSRWTC